MINSRNNQVHRNHRRTVHPIWNHQYDNEFLIPIHPYMIDTTDGNSQASMHSYYIRHEQPIDDSFDDNHHMLQFFFF